MKTMKDLLDFYDFEVDNNHNVYIIKEGERHIVPLRSFYSFEHNREGMTREEEQALVDKGEAMFISKYEILGAIKGYDEETVFKMENKYGFRTKKYLDAILSNIGFVNSDGGWDEPEYLDEPIQIGKSDTVCSTSRMLLGKVKNGLYCASYSLYLPPDDYSIEKYFFTKKPSKKDVLTAIEVRKLKFAFFSSKLHEVYECWECSHTTHWLDLEGSLSKKISQMEDKYCGC